MGGAWGFENSSGTIDRLMAGAWDSEAQVERQIAWWSEPSRVTDCIMAGTRGFENLSRTMDHLGPEPVVRKSEWDDRSLGSQSRVG